VLQAIIKNINTKKQAKIVYENNAVSQ